MIGPTSPALHGVADAVGLVSAEARHEADRRVDEADRDAQVHALAPALLDLDAQLASAARVDGDLGAREGAVDASLRPMHLVIEPPGVVADRIVVLFLPRSWVCAARVSASMIGAASSGDSRPSATRRRMVSSSSGIGRSSGQPCGGLVDVDLPRFERSQDLELPGRDRQRRPAAAAESEGSGGVGGVGTDVRRPGRTLASPDIELNWRLPSPPPMM